MAGFKEPQPRKKAPGAQEPMKNGDVASWPPYARQGGEAISEAPSLDAQWTMSEVEFYQSLATAHEEGRAEALGDFQARKAALEAACALQGNQPPANFWGNVEALEAYLRDGTKP